MLTYSCLDVLYLKVLKRHLALQYFIYLQRVFSVFDLFYNCWRKSGSWKVCAPNYHVKVSRVIDELNKILICRICVCRICIWIFEWNCVSHSIIILAFRHVKPYFLAKYFPTKRTPVGLKFLHTSTAEYVPTRDHNKWYFSGDTNRAAMSIFSCIKSNPRFSQQSSFTSYIGMQMLVLTL